jgi:hypothetical protein
LHLPASAGEEHKDFWELRTVFLPGLRVLRVLKASMPTLSFGFVLVFLLFSAIFFFNSYRLWFKTDKYYEDVRSSLTHQPSIYPFREFFLKRMENKERWVLWQKIFSAVGLAAVIAADILVIVAWIS